MLIFSFSSFANLNLFKDFSLLKIEKDSLSEKLSHEFFGTEDWPEYFNYNHKVLAVDYTVKKDLNDYIIKELKRYGSAYASVVVLDNDSGKILSAVDYTRSTRKIGKNLTFSATNPAASVFKVITAADLVENAQIVDNSEFNFNGKSTTLYKYQLKNKPNRWTRTTTFEKAFARSNNVVFGKAAINYLNHDSLKSMARKFGFDQNIMQLMDIGDSKLFDKDTEYGLAEFASGFNKQTLISPVHGALIASVIANDGVMKKPTLVNKIVQKDNQLLIWESQEQRSRVLSQSSAEEMKKLMELTVSKGTARSAFNKWRTRRRLKDVTIGGKTGTITGGVPFGKRDWFVSYAMPKNGESKGISVCVMIVNVKKWYIKSPVLAKNIIEYYYSNIN
ncbi:MAG: hypothetical protein CME62_02760 [Halobacteriovoraceae bacterium]|nr:hypothetical protein [Halobacteriovoraceae bacterium]|tara:strand:- start:3031 stop:4200 length:1170 start_codon:yes stop_codon:yes gene_type:complete